MVKNYIFSLLTLILAFTATVAQTTQTIPPTDDTYSDGGSPNEVLNDTKAGQIWVKTGSSAQFTRFGFLKFDIAGLAIEDVGTAKLRLYCYDTQSTTMEISAFNIDDAWSESTLTFSNQPAFILPSVRKKTVETNAYVEWQISELVRNAIAAGKTEISIGLSDESGANQLARFYSKESSNPNKPELFVSDEVEGFQSLTATADAMVVGGSNATTNYGSDASVQIKEGSSNATFVKRGLIKFDLNQLDPNKVSSVGTARIKLYFTSSNNSSPDVNVSLQTVENNWDENTVTWNSFPAITNSESLRTTKISPDDLDRYYTFDISPYVIARLEQFGFDGIISLAIRDLGNANNGVTFNSKEATAFLPVLELLEEPTNVPPQDAVSTGVYYVDATNGDDTNTGLSEATAWKSLAKINEITFGPGTRVLFKTGESWNGSLKLKGSGEDGAPIIIASYGQGSKPILNGEGVSETILLAGNEYVEVRNLEITNYNPAEEDGISMEAWELKNVTDWYNDPEAGYDLTANTNKVGVRLTAQDAGEVNHIHLVNLDIHGINGNNEDKDNGGIFMEIMGSLIPTYYNDLLIEGCHIYDVDRTGLSNVSTWDTRTLTDNGNWTPTLNYIVRNNVFERSGANALILRNALNPVIEYNLFHQCAVKGSGNAAFNFNTDGALFQFNEARFTKANVGDEDAGGLDSDFRTKNTTLQYNYVHDNAYGMLATGGGFDTSFNDNTTFRYNIIERDGLLARENGEKFAFKLSGKITNTKFHNNVIYLSPEQTGVSIMLHKRWRRDPDQTEYYNNIYYLEGTDHTFELRGSSNNTFSNNIFFSNGDPVNVPVDNNAINTDPKFVQIGEGVAGYKLQSGSPAIGTGIEVNPNAAVGYYGNLIPETGTIDRGVHQFSTEANTGTPGNFNKNNFDVYLLIGQSNMAGRGEIGALDEIPVTDAYLFNGTGWETAEVPLNRYSTARKDLDLQRMNPGYTFARKLTEFTDRGIGLVVNARGGSSIDQWQKGYTGSDDFDLYENAVTRLMAAKSAGTFKGILWHQGESNQNSSGTYMVKLKQLVADLRADLGTNAFFVAGEINQWRPESEPINKVIASIANDINQATYVKSDDLSPINNDLTDPHFDGFSQRILGGLYADKILENVYGISKGIATAYSQCDYEGYALSLSEGIYDLEELAKRGFIDNDLGSLKMEEGYEARLFTGQQDGQSILLNSSSTCLSDTDVGDDVSFFVIGKTGTTADTLGTGDLWNDSGTIRISPNPANQKLNIHMSANLVTSGVSSVQLLDLQGRAISLDLSNVISRDNIMEFDLNNYRLNSGLYFVRIQAEDQIFNNKLIIK